MSNASESMSPGEMKAVQRETHLCFACAHACVCKVAAAISPELLVIIQQCLAFEAASLDAGDEEARQ